MYDNIDEDYYKLIRIGNAFSSNYIEYKSNGDKDKTLSTKEYLDKIKPYLNNVINNLVTQDEWKIQLIMAIKFTSSKDSKETRTMYTKSGNIETMIGGKIDENIEERFESVLQRYQKDLEESKKRSKLIFDGVDLLYYKCNKRSLNSGGSYVDFPK